MKRGLTKSEKNILRLLGYSREDMAEKLCVSRATVDSHLHNLFKKFKVSESKQLILKALITEQIYLKDIDIGFWDDEGVYKEDIQTVDLRKE